MATKGNLRLYLLVLLIAVAAVALGIYVQHQSKQINTADLNATFLPQPRAISPFQLQQTNGKPFNNAALQKHWTFMFFGFTNCPSICPTTMAEMNKLYQKLQQDKVSSLPQVVMISIDPDRDDLNRLQGYVQGFNPAFVGARGDEAQIAALTKQLGIVHMKVFNTNKQSSSNMGYDIDHSGAVMLFNPQGQLVAFFSMPHDALTMAKDYEIITHQS